LSSTNTPILEKLRASGGSNCGEPVRVYAVDKGVDPGATNVHWGSLTTWLSGSQVRMIQLVFPVEVPFISPQNIEFPVTRIQVQK
jgi:hypothetical protein